MSKYDLHLLWIDFHIIFGYLLIAHNNQIDSQEQIEVKELKIQDIEYKDKKDGQDIQEEAKVQPRIGYKFSGIYRFICDLLFKLGLIIIVSIFVKSFVIFELILIFKQK